MKTQPTSISTLRVVQHLILKISVFTFFIIALFSAAVSQAQVQELTKEKKELDERVRNTLKENAQTIRFLENKGQLDNDDVLYYFQSANGSVYIERERIRFVALKDTAITEEEYESAFHPEDEEHGEHEEEEGEMVNVLQGTHTFSVYLDGSNPSPHIRLGESFATTYNYFLGADPKNWASGVKAAKDLTIEDVYPGIDLRLYSNQDGSMEFDWIIDPGADYTKVKLNFEGQDGLNIDQSGSLNVGLRFTEVKFDIPESYQVTESGKVPVNFLFTKTGEKTIAFTTESILNPQYPIVIDPVLKWGTFMDGNLAAFDAYLFATQVDPVDGMVYCAGGSNQNLSTGAPPYTANGYLNSIIFTNTSQGVNAYPTAAVVYRINSSGTTMVDYTLYGPNALSGTSSPAPFIVAQALSLSPTGVFIGGVTNQAIPIPPVPATQPFDNSLSGVNDGFVASFSRDLGTLNYATYLGGALYDTLGVTSIRAISNNSFAVGMTMTGAAPAGYISAGAAQTVPGGGTDMYIAKFGSYNTLTWGTYAGGLLNDYFNDLELFGDGRVAFAGYGRSTLIQVNSSAAQSALTDLDGIVGVLKTTGLAPFNYLDEIGGSGNDRIFDVELVGSTLYWTGSVSSGFPTSAGVYDAGHNGSTDVVVGKVGDVGGSYAATFYGTASADLGNGIKLVTTTNCAGVQTNFLLVFGTVGGTGLPTLNLNSENFFSSTYTPGGNSNFDMFFAGFNSNLTALTYGTYMGGNADDYLGNTGEPRGSNHLWVNNTDVYLGTTTHSASHLPVLVSGGFDTGKSNGSNDAHIIISVSFNSIIESDYGDAPNTYGSPSHSLDCTHLKIGSTSTSIDPELVAAPGSLANGDDIAGSDDEDGIITLPSFSDGGPQTVSVTVSNLNNTTGSEALVYGWIDFDADGIFEATEFDTVKVPTGSVNVSRILTFPSVTISGAAAKHYLRIRLTTNILNDVVLAGSVDERSTATASNGEIEDYRAASLTCPANMSFSGCDQAAVNAAFASWINLAKRGGGCIDSTYSATPNTPPSFCGGATTVTFSYSTGCTSTLTCMSTFTVTNPGPVITTCAAPRIIDGCSTAAILTPPFSAVNAASSEAVFETTPNSGNASDNCSISTVLYRDVTSGTCPIIVSRIWTITDACGSSSTCIQTITVRDITNPVITTCAVPLTIDGCSTAAITTPPFNTNPTTVTESVFESSPNNGNTSDNCGVASVSYRDVATGSCPINVLRRWTITDACGNTATCNQTITIRDITVPNIVTCAVPRTIDACNTAAITSPPFNTGTTASTEVEFESSPNNGNVSDNCTSPVSVTYRDVSSGSCPIVVTRRWTISDACGNSATCNQTITVRDITPPVITSGTIAACYPTVAAAQTAALAATSATDNCSAVTETVGTVGTCNAVVTVSETDACNNTSTKVYNTSIDNSGPSITTCPVPYTIDACSTAGITTPPFSGSVQTVALSVFTSSPNNGAATDACGISTVTYSDISTGTCPIIVTRRWTVSDICGNTATCNQTITVRDITSPNIVACAVPLTIDGCSTAALTTPPFNTNTTATTEGVFESAPNNGNVSDNCSNPVSVTYRDVSSGTCPIVVIRRWTVSDLCGNTSTCNQTITIRDITPPVITSGTIATCYPTVVAAEAAALAATSATDNCSAVTEAASTTGTCTAVVTVTETDACLNTSTKTYNTTIDGTGPNITTCAAPRIIDGCNTAAISTPPFSVSTVASTIGVFTTNPNSGVASDACGITTVTYSDISSGTCPIVVTRRWTIGDACGNTSTCNQSITIRDITPPVITSGTIAACYPTVAAAEAAALAATSATDNCSAVTEAASTSGTCTAVITVTETDACLNTSTKTYNTTIDGASPNITTCAAPRIIDGCNTAAISTPPFSPSTVASTIGVFTTSPNSGAASDACGITTVTYSDISSGTCPIVVTRRWTIGDACGNTSTCNQSITVRDITPPVITSGTIASCYPTVAAAEAAALAATSATDNCSGVTETVSTVGTCTAVVTVTERDACLNTATKTYNTSIDGTSPNIITCAAPRVIDGCSIAAITSPQFAASTTATTVSVFTSTPNNGAASDACGITTVTYSDVATGTCPIVVTRRWTIGDACGNTSTCNQSITVRDITPPVCQTQNITITVNPLTGLASITASQVNNGSFDACSSVMLGVSPSNFSCSNAGPNVVVLTVTDLCNNTSTCTATVTVTGCADLSLTKTVSYNSMTNLATFTITVTNNGPNPATGIEATDQLPSGYSYVGNAPSQGSYNNISGLWLVGNLGVGAFATLNITATVNPGVGLNYLNKAQITEDQQYDPDSDPETNDTVDDLNDGVVDDDEASASLSTADLSLTKTAGIYNPVNNQIVFTITVLNSGPTTATNVVVTDQLPNAYAFVGSSASQGSYSNVTGLWTIGTMLNGASVTLTITATVNTGIGLNFTNAAQITHSDQLDPDSNPNTGPTVDENGDGNGDDDDEDNATPIIADLNLTKTAGAFNPVNNQLVFTITVTNNGPNNATGVQVTDQLPSGYSFVGSSATVGSYSNVTKIWTVGNLNNGSSASLSLTALVLTGNGLIYTNSAQITNSDQIDPDSSPDTGPTVDEDGDSNGDDDDEDNATPIIADLSLTKTAGIYNPVTNQLNFTITVLNSGPNNATAVQVTDQLPNGYNYVTSVPSQGAYNNISGVWTVGNLANGANATLTITVTVNTGIGLIFTNAAQITNSDQIDPDSSPDTGPTVDEDGNGNGDDDDEDNATPIIADLSLTKTAGIYNPVTNQLNFTITVLNSGPNNATAVQVTDQLPNAYNYVTSVPSQGAYNNISGIWTVGNLANGASATLTITVTVNTGIGLIYLNAAQITNSDQIDPDSSPDTGPTVDEDGNGNGDDDDEDNAVPIIADLSLTKTVGTHNPLTNQVVFTITVLNSGPNGATGVQVTDVLPSGFMYVSNIPSQGFYSNVTGLWSIGSLANGSSVTLMITATVKAGVGLNYTNDAEITTSDQIDPDSSPDTGPTVDEDGNGNGDDDDEDNVTLQVADLSLTKIVSDNTPDQGSNITYTITVTNSGPSGATGVQVKDQLPFGVNHVSNMPSVGIYNPISGIWTIGSLANGATATLQIVATVVGSGTITNFALINATDQVDPDSDPFTDFSTDDYFDNIPDDDEASVPITVNCGNCNVINGPTPPVCPGTTSVFNAQITGLCQNPVYHWTVTGNVLSFTPSGSLIIVTAGPNCNQPYTVNLTIDCEACGTSPIACFRTILVQDITPPAITACAVTRNIEGCSLGAITNPPFSTALTISDEQEFEDQINQGNVTDVCGVTSVTYKDVSSLACPIVVTRTWTVKDGCGNSATCNQTIYVNDTTPPNIVACAVTRNIEGCNLTALTGPAYATTLTSSSEAVFENTTNNGNVTDACGNLVVNYIDVASGSCPIVVTRKWTVIDACGNTATCNQTINVDDNTVPVFTFCPGNTTISCPATPTFGTPTAADVCDPMVTITSTDLTIPGTCPARYSVIRTWTAVDDCGNSATCSASVTVQDNTKPDIRCPQDLVLTCATGINYVALINAWIATATATDACDANVPVTSNYDGMSIPNFSCQAGLVITFTATDDCGNSATCFATVRKPCFNLDTWVYLEGSAVNPNGGNTYTLPMRTTLNDLRVLPGQVLVDPFFGVKYSPPGQPYINAPWNYTGIEGNSFDSGGSSLNASAGYPSTVVDWVLVSLRVDSAQSSVPLCQTAGLLHNDGRVQLISPLTCCGVDENTAYFIVIEHRNHLIVMSGAKASFINHNIAYDFRFQQSYEDPLFAGLNIFAREKEILTGRFAMFTGNGNQNGSANADTDITFDDRSLWESQNGAVGFYRIGDYNLNGDTNFNDRIAWERNNGKFTSVPRN